MGGSVLVTNGLRIRMQIREAQKHANLDPDPQHRTKMCHKGHINDYLLFVVESPVFFSELREK
jgi:hypothetical protein